MPAKICYIINVATEKAKTEREREINPKLYQNMRRQKPIKKFDAANIRN